jgi:hypothetical protein
MGNNTILHISKQPSESFEFLTTEVVSGRDDKNSKSPNLIITQCIHV